MLFLLLKRVIALLPVLAKKIFPVVVPVRCADDRMDVISGRYVVCKRNPALMVEFYKYDRAVDSVVKHTIVAGRAAHPGEVGLVQMLLHFVHLDPGLVRSGAVDIGLGKVE
jgi:hypothetical protein